MAIEFEAHLQIAEEWSMKTVKLASITGAILIAMCVPLTPAFAGCDTKDKAVSDCSDDAKAEARRSMADASHDKAGSIHDDCSKCTFEPIGPE